MIQSLLLPSHLQCTTTGAQLRDFAQTHGLTKIAAERTAQRARKKLETLLNEFCDQETAIPKSPSKNASTPSTPKKRKAKTIEREDEVDLLEGKADMVDSESDRKPDVKIEV